MRQQDGKEDKGVFGPLMKTDGPEPGLGAGLSFAEGSYRFDASSTEGGTETCSRVGDHGVQAVLQERKIGERVSDVAEVVPELLAEGGQLVVSGEIDDTVGGQDAGEDSELVGDMPGGGGVGGRGEVDLAASRAFLLKILQEFPVVREVRDIQMSCICDMALERGLALQKPAGESKQQGRMVSGKGER